MWQVLVAWAAAFVLGAPVVWAGECATDFGRLGAHADAQALTFRLFSSKATRVELFLYDQPYGEPRTSYVLEKDGDTWHARADWGELRAKGLSPDKPVYYGYRVWGPNWQFRGEWKPGSEKGFVVDVDAEGNRFNPNKLVFDPYARELSHPPRTPQHPDGKVYATGPGMRQLDSGPVAPKGIVLPEPKAAAPGPRRALADDVVYEVHLRGFTMNDPEVPPEERGTYRGAARKARYLKELGVTAVEFLPLQEFQNGLNREDDTRNNDYWGYNPLAYFAPSRRYATETSRRIPGGVTEEFREMVEAFHREGIKVLLDVVYNHTGEQGAGGKEGELTSLYSLRGLDSSAYYQTASDKRFFHDNTGCGANLNCAHPRVRDLIADSLKHFQRLGVDGFRFDLAPVLGNARGAGGGFQYDKMAADNTLNRLIRELPARPLAGGDGLDLLAEPWAIGDGTYQLGQFPHHDVGRGWAEWNGRYRDVIRRSLNRFGVATPTPSEMATALSGSSDLFGARGPGASVNFVVAHDGFTLRDLVSFNAKNNNQPPPFGPSDGGTDENLSWDQGGDEARQRQAARNAFALPMLSLGTPMFTGGDEFLRTQRGNNNMWNVDAKGSWIDWSEKDRQGPFFDFARAVIAFRHAHGELRAKRHAAGVQWHRPDGQPADAAYLDNAANAFLGYRVGSTFIAYNWKPEAVKLILPPPSPGKSWHRAGDTDAKYEAQGNFAEPGKELPIPGVDYELGGRAIAVFVEK